MPRLTPLTASAYPELRFKVAVLVCGMSFDCSLFFLASIALCTNVSDDIIVTTPFKSGTYNSVAVVDQPDGA